MNPKKIKNYQEYIAKRIMRVRNGTNPITTQEQLADYLHVRKSTISMYENGHNMPDISTLMEIAHFFGMTLDDFLEHDYDYDWFKKEKNLEDLDDEKKFSREFTSIFRNIDSEGKKLLREMGSFIRSRYKRNFEKELDEAERKEEKAAEDYTYLSELHTQIDELTEENEELKIKLGLFKVVKPDEDLLSLENKALAQQGYIILSDIGHKKIEERIKMKKQLANQLEAEEMKKNTPHKSGIFIEWDGNETLVPIDKIDDPTK